MKKIEILSGNFATGTDNQGNFNGYDDDGVRYFIAKRLMDAFGWTTNELVKAAFPFYAKADTKIIGQLDADGAVALNADGTPVTRERLQVMSIFKTRQDLITSYVNKASLDIEIQAGIMKVATTAGLTDAHLKVLAEASF